MRADRSSGAELNGPVRHALQQTILAGVTTANGYYRAEEASSEADSGGGVRIRSGDSGDGMSDMFGGVRGRGEGKSVAEMQSWVPCEVHRHMAGVTFILPKLSPLIAGPPNKFELSW